MYFAECLHFPLRKLRNLRLFRLYYPIQKGQKGYGLQLRKAGYAVAYPAGLFYMDLSFDVLKCLFPDAFYIQ